MLLPEGPDILYAQTLWVFPPQHEHGWVGNPEQDAEIAVFHFQTVPPAVEHYCLGTEEQFLQISLNKHQCGRLRELAEQALRYRQNPNLGSIICYQHILSELSLLVYEACVREQHPSSQAHAQQCVEKALQWYSDHLAENPDQEAIARIAAVSVSHLRRLFHETMGNSPRQVMDQLKFERATQLMSDPKIKLNEVAEICGFQSASAFSRAFKTFFGCSPAVWRGY
jgi:AraC family transcriptional regulator